MRNAFRPFQAADGSFGVTANELSPTSQLVPGIKALTPRPVPHLVPEIQLPLDQVSIPFTLFS